MSKKNCLEVANGIVSGDRNDDYGHPYHDFSRSAKMISGILLDKLKEGVEIEPHEVPLIMIAVKVSREINKAKPDNPVDIAGYARTLEMVREYEQAEKPDSTHHANFAWAPELTDKQKEALGIA